MEQAPSEDDDVGREPAAGDQPRIYVASLSDYNAGRLHGAWINADQPSGGLASAIEAMLKRSREPIAEEWAIHDFEGFGQLRLSEYEALATVSRIAQGVAEHGLAYAAWAEICDRDHEALESFDENYLGHWPDPESYASELFDDLGYASQLEDALPKSIQPYVRLDSELLARDLELGGDITTAAAPDGGVWIFDARW